MRFATESGVAGVALWRLGSEDERTWSFYDRNMTKDSIRNFDFASFANIQTPDNVSYFGHGEVLDILATPHKGNIRPDIDSVDILIAEENYDSLPVNFTAKKLGRNASHTIRNRKKLAISFRDGPHPTGPPTMLNIPS